ncbi:MAG: class I tRNA ligase family protein, partial [Hyphomicrobiales bacterium]
AREGAAADSGRALEIRRAAHRTLDAVGRDVEALRFNRAIARIYELSNVLQAGLQEPPSDGLNRVLRETAEIITRIAAPMVPHLAEECWRALGHDTVVAEEPWPTADPDMLVSDTITLAVQVNGKRRAELAVERGLGRSEIETAAMELDNVRRAIDGKPVRKVIVVPERIVNVVTG